MNNNPSNSTSSADPLPLRNRVIEFRDLDQTLNLKAAKDALNGLVGVYAIINNITGAVYIGSSNNIGSRLVNHLIDNNTNEHLQNAIEKYGLENFTFAVVEFCDSSVLLQHEQYHLDILFSLPANLRYNFSPVAGAPIAGRNHTPGSKAQMSDSQQLVDRSGIKNPMYGKAPVKPFQSGPNHPMYGVVPAHAMTVNVYSAVDNQLVHSFSSQVAAAKWLNVTQATVSNYVKSGKVWNKLYTLGKSTHLK